MDEIKTTATVPAQMDVLEDSKDGADHVDYAPAAVDTGSKFAVVQQEAVQGQLFEASLTNKEAFKLYRKAVFWAFIACFSIIMEGYDGAVTGTYTALPVYRQYFGTYYPKINQWQIPAQWQTALGTAGAVGNFIGIPMGSFLIERLGYRRALMINYVLVIPLIAILAFAKNLTMLYVGGLLQSIPFGVFSTLAVGYASEVVPAKLRGYLTGWIDTCWVLGILFGTGIANVIVDVKSIWGFRVGYMTQWAWPIQLFFFMWAAPEAPWWLIRKGRVADAEKAMRRLTSPKMHDQVSGIVNNMVRTYQLELDVAKHPKWYDIFRGVDRRRTEIACMAMGSQSLAGAPFAASPIYFFEQAGLDATQSFRLGLANPAFLFIANVGGYFAMSKIGRRTLYCYGMFGCFLLLLVIGGITKASFTHPNAKWATASFVFVWNICHGFAMGPETYALTAEASSTRLRNQTIACARLFYVTIGLIANFFEPWLINPSALNLKGYTAFVWAPICFTGWVWMYFRLPEFKDRTFYEIDVLFDRKIPARKFRTTEVEPLADETIREEQDLVHHV